MKNTTHTQNLTKRHQSEQRAARKAGRVPQIEQNLQASTLTGGCGTPAKFEAASFYKISNEYFAEEAPRSFAVEAGVYGALMAMAMLPIVNGVQAVAALIHTIALF